MKLNVNSEKMYSLLPKEAKQKISPVIENAFIESKPLEDVVRFYIGEASNEKDGNLINNMYFLMLNNIINGEEEYVKHVHELVKEDKTDPFRISVNKLIGVFYLNGTFDINIKTELANSDAYISISNGEAYRSIPSSARTIDFSELCINKNKTFSHNSLKEIIELVRILLINYPQFKAKIFSIKESEKQLTK